MNETISRHRDTSSAERGSAGEQTAVVRAHFKDASTRWGARYGGRPRRMSDLDLLLRREMVHRLLRPLAADADRPLRVLDVGCGSGDVLDGFPRDSVHVLGVDLVPEMVAAAARSHPGDRFVAASIERMPFSPCCADVVTCLGVLEYLPDAGEALVTVQSLLRPGGHLIVSFPNKWSLCRKLTRAEVRIERAILRGAAWLRGRRREPDADPKYRHHSWSPPAIRKLLSAAGFVPGELLLHTYGLWGVIGRHPLSLRLSAWLSRRFCREGLFSEALACTIVARAAKPAEGGAVEGGAPARRKAPRCSQR